MKSGRLTAVRRGVGIGLLLLLAWPAVAATPPDSLNQRLRACADSVRQLRETNRNPAALALVGRCLPAVVPATAKAGAARLCFERALCERKEGQFAAGIKTIRQAIRWAEQARDTASAAQDRYVLGMLYADRGDYTQAVAQCHANLRWYQRVPKSTYVADTHQLLAEVYERLRNASAATYHRAAYQRLARQSDDPEQRMLAYNNEAIGLSQRRQYKQALAYQQRAVAAARRLPNALLPDITDQLVMLAQLQRQLHQFKPALASLREASGWLRQRSSPAPQALLQNELAALKLAMNRPLEADTAGRLALRYARLSNRPDVVLVVLNTWQRVQERNGNDRAALQTAQAAYALFDSLATLAKTQAIADIETRYGVARKEADIRALREEATLQRLQAEARQRDLREASRQRRWLSIGVSMVGLILLVVGYLYRQSKRLQQQTEQQRQLLEEQAGQLYVANATKDRLFSIIGHDLRSSARALHQSITRLANATPAEADPRDTLWAAERDAYQLSQQISNLLYWALAQQNGLRVHRRTESLADLVTDAVAGFQTLLHHQSLRLLNETGPECVETDERLVLLVIRNLLHNAIKFTPPGGQIRLRSYQTGYVVYLSISDTGPGLPATRDGQAHSATEPGTGLGLMVSGELMQHCGGTLRVQNARPHGTEVILGFAPNSSPGSLQVQPANLVTDTVASVNRTTGR